MVKNILGLGPGALGLEERSQLRTHDPEFLSEIRKLRCFACGASPPSEAHHIRSRGAGGGDDHYNMLPLCSFHHTGGKDAWHRGRLNFLEKFPHVWEHLEKLGWEMNGDKLFHPEFLNADK